MKDKHSKKAEASVCNCREHEHEHEHVHGEADCCSCGCGHEHSESEGGAKTVLRYALGAVPIIIGFMSFIPYRIPLIASVVGYLIFGAEVFKGMLVGFSKKNVFTEFTLMCVATVGAFAIGEYADAAALMYLYSLGEAISSRAYVSSKRSISELIEITPEYANVLRDGVPVRVAPSDVRVGELILVRSGERVPLDGTVTDGGGNADTSSVTGESKPLELYEGIACPSGAVLEDGELFLRVENEYESSVVFKLRTAVELANKRKSAAEKKISRFAAVFTPIAFAAAVCVFAVGALATGDAVSWLRAAIMVLVVSCPCSLVLSVPLTYFAGVGAAASRGIIFRGGEVMDRAARLGCIAFDKTGTITGSELSFDGTTLYSDMSEDSFLSLSRAVLEHSPHAAAVSFCGSYPVGSGGYTVENAVNVGGRGIICDVNGKRTLFGNARLMRENGIEAQEAQTTAIYGACDGVLLGRLEFSSHLKEGVADAVRDMRSLGVARIAVISGDALGSVAVACDNANIDEYYGSCAPDEKLEVFERISKEEKSKGGKSFSAYCGDGLNDSAVIAAADVGIAMGGCGSALTVESADIVLTDDDPSRIAEAIRIARRTSSVANANVALSLGIKLGVLVASTLLAYFKLDVPIELAMVADVGAAVTAVLNSLRAAKKEKR